MFLVLKEERLVTVLHGKAKKKHFLIGCEPTELAK
jgi:hypothetical protein